MIKQWERSFNLSYLFKDYSTMKGQLLDLMSKCSSQKQQSFQIHLLYYIIFLSYFYYSILEAMQSSVYPNILFVKNQNLCFIGSQLTSNMQQFVLLHPSDPLIQTYTNLVQKLFSEITILKQMLWICKIPSTSIVRIYFSQPYQYPAAYCCRQPVYVELEHDLSGTFTCSKCKKVISKFVYSMETDSSDEEIFRRKQRELKNRKQNMRQLLTSQKFRGKNLKNNFFKEPKVSKNGGFVMEIKDQSVREQKHLSLSTNRKNQEHLQEMRAIINDIFS